MPHLVEDMFSVKLMPWHGLGTILDNPPTSEEAIKAAGLDWPVEKRRLLWQKEIETDQGRIPTVPEEVEGKKLLVRHFNGEDQILSVVSNRYQPLQNIEAFNFFDPVISSGFAEYETAGSLSEGKKIFILAKISREFDVGNGDTVRQYLLLVNGHDAQTGIMIQPTPIRVVCNNTLQMSLGYGMIHNIRHQGDLKTKLDEASEIIGFSEKAFAKIKRLFLQLRSKECSAAAFESFLSELLPDPPDTATERVWKSHRQSKEKIRHLLEAGENYNLEAGKTWWHVYNAAVEFADYYLGKRSRDRINYQLLGAGSQFKKNALDISLELSGFGPRVDKSRGRDEPVI